MRHPKSAMLAHIMSIFIAIYYIYIYIYILVLFYPHEEAWSNALKRAKAYGHALDAYSQTHLLRWMVSPDRNMESFNLSGFIWSVSFNCVPPFEKVWVQIMSPC